MQDIGNRSESHAHLELVRQARAGKQNEMSALAGLVRERVYPFIQRTLLDHDKSEDLAQETVLAVLKAFRNLKEPERFWAWVFAIATSQVRQHFRQRSRNEALQMLDIDMVYLPYNSPDEDNGGFVCASQKELGELTRTAMAQISVQYRMVLALRFYEDLPHGEIGRILGCSALRARMRFFKAKRALMRELGRLGVNRDTFLAALGAFGIITLAPSAKATAVSVSASAAGEGLATVFACAQARIACLVACLAVVAGLAALGLREGAPAKLLPPTVIASQTAGPITTSPDTRYVHFSTARIVPGGTAPREASYKFWYLYPEGDAGPVLMRMEIWDAHKSYLRWLLLQTGEARYDINMRAKTVFIRNYGLFEGLSTYDPLPTLPTDPQSMCDFAVAVEGEQSVAMGNKSGPTFPSFSFRRDPKTGYVIDHEEIDDRDAKETVAYHYSPFDSRLIAFTCPPGMKVVDRRDEIHKRGWVCFDVRGELAGRPVAGLGRMPLTYDASRSHQPFLQMRIGGMTVIDRSDEALLVDGSAGPAVRFAGRSFFKGLPRPWMGFTAADTVRRDAARERVWYSNPYPREGGKAEFTLLREDKAAACPLMAKYLIDRKKGLVERIEYWRAAGNAYDESIGHLAFSYETDPASVEAAARLVPAPAAVGGPAGQTNVFWPIDLIMDRVREGGPSASVPLTAPVEVN